MLQGVTWGGRFVKSVKNARWSMSLQEAGDGLESIVEFQVQIKGHNQREYEDNWQGWQNWTDEKLATKLTRGFVVVLCEDFSLHLEVIK